MTELMARVENKNGVLVVSSRVIAEQLGRNHKDVLESLDKIGVAENFADLKNIIIPSTYIHHQNKQEYREYLLTEKGFTLYMFNVQGHNDFKLSYINEFERMKNALSNQNKVPTTFKEALLLAVEQQDEIERLTLENKTKDQVILEYTPKIEYLDKILEDKDSTLTITQIAKDYGISGNKLNEILHENKVQYKQNGTWLLYTNHTGKGYTKSKTWNNGDKTGLHTKWTQKGRLFIHELLNKNGIVALEDKI